MAPDAAAHPVRLGAGFGWQHEAHGPTPRLPVLLCPPLGLEALASHRALRDLAVALAAQGHECFRLDYPGCGLSPGVFGTPALLEGAQETLHDAISAIRATTGAAQVLLVGLRLGATLAATLATTRRDIAALVALAPVISGRRHARELKALAQMQGFSNPDELRANGFAFSPALLDHFAALDLSALPAPAPAGLVLAESDSEAALATRWGFETAPFEGLEALIGNPTFARAPEAAFAAVLAFAQRFDAGETGPKTPLPPARIEEGAGEIRALPIEGAAHLAAQWHQAGPRPAPCALVIVNAGRNPACGWGRQGVDMAQAMVAAGHDALLLDLSGVGDSGRRAGDVGEALYSAGHAEDIRAAAAALRAQGARRIFVLGACSGAYAALRAAQADASIRGIVLVNLLRFHWQPGESLDENAPLDDLRPTRAYRERLFRAATWARLLRGEIAVGTIGRTLLRRLGAAITSRLSGGARSREQEARGWFEGLAARGQRALLLHGPEDPSRRTLEAYFGAGGRGLAGLAEVAFIDTGDHNLSPQGGRVALREAVLALMADQPAG